MYTMCIALLSPLSVDLIFLRSLDRMGIRFWKLSHLNIVSFIKINVNIISYDLLKYWHFKPVRFIFPYKF